MARKSGSEGADGMGEDFVSAVDRLRRDAAPVIAKALDLDRAEAAEAALNAVTELALAARALLRALPLPPDSLQHVENAEREAIRAAKLAVASLDKEAKKRGRSAKLQKVSVDFGPAPPTKRKASPPGKQKRSQGGKRKRSSRTRKK